MVPFSKGLNAVDPLLLEGREILFNRKSGLHNDQSDPHLAWAILLALGNFKGGYIRVPALGLRARLEPGDAIFIRGRVLKHEIEAWSGGQRISIPHFTHTSVWRAAGMVNEVLII